MGWSEDVHSSRLSESLAQARYERKLKTNGQHIPATSNGNLPSLFVSTAAAVSFVVWRKHQKQISELKWKEWPIVKQFYELITGSGSTASRTALSRAKANNNRQKTVVSGSGKAKTTPKGTSSTAVTTPAAAAAAAALKRAEGQQTGTTSVNAQPQPSSSQQQEEGHDQQGEDSITQAGSDAAAGGSGAPTKKKKKIKK